MALSPGVYWHPLNLPHFVTLRDLSEFAFARLTVPVTNATAAPGGSEYILRAVFSETRELLLSGDWQVIALVEFTGAGYHVGEWQAIPPAARLTDTEVYIGMLLETQIAANDLTFGQAELRCR